MCGSAAAQTISDTELQAGYCLGVTASQADARAAILKKEAGDPIMRNYDQDVLRHIQERHRRFQEYLIANGFTWDRSSEALRIASERGKKDVATCDAELEQEFYKECDERCDKVLEQNTDAGLACYDKCPSPASCDSLKKCLESFLPF